MRWLIVALAAVLTLAVFATEDVRNHRVPDSETTAAFCGPTPTGNDNTDTGQDGSAVFYYWPAGKWILVDQNIISRWSEPCGASPEATVTYECLVSQDNEGVAIVSKTSDRILFQSEGGGGICDIDYDDLWDGGGVTSTTYTWGADADCDSSSPGTGNDEGMTFVPDRSLAGVCKYDGFILVGTQGGGTGGIWKYCIPLAGSTLDCLAHMDNTDCDGATGVNALEYDFDTDLVWVMNDQGANSTSSICSLDPRALVDDTAYTILETRRFPAADVHEGFAFGVNGKLGIASDFSDGEDPQDGLWVFKDIHRSGGGYVWPYKLWNWRARKKITIKGSDNTEFPGTTALTNFPLLISFTDSTNVFRSDGFDIVFTDILGTTLDHDLDEIDSATGKIVAWVRMPTLSTTADTDIFVYLNNASQGSTLEAEGNTWSAPFIGVYHLAGSDTTPDDASGNANAMSETGDPTEGATGKIGAGVTVARGSSILTVPTLSAYNPDTTDLSICAWFNMSAFAAGADVHVMGHGSGDAGFPLNERFYWRVEGDGARLASRVGTTNPTDDNYTTSTATWYRACVVHNSDGATGGTDAYSAYQNGTVFTQVNNLTATFDHNPFHAVADWTFGGSVHATNGFGEGMNGTLDEIWIRTTDVSADQIATEYRNQNAPANTVTIGSLEPRPRRASR